MMTDRFDAQLRQHLLETANERPADGQLAAIVAGTAVTTQRRPLAARLPGFQARVGPFPAVVRFGLIAVALVLAAVAGAILAGGSQPRPSTVFEGTWTTIDPLDRSTMNLYVGAGAEPAVRFVDDLATGGACDLDPVKRFTADGTGEISGNRLKASFPDGGGCGLMTVDVAQVYRYDAGSDTLLDQDRLAWARVEGGAPPPTQRPPNEPPPTQAPPEPTTGQPSVDPTAEAACVDLAQSGTYTAPVGSLLGPGPVSLTATVPSRPAVPWQGLQDTFHLTSSCEDVAAMSFFAMTATSVNDGGCMASSAEITDFADAIARLDQPRGNDISDRIDLTIDGHPAARYDISNLSTCTGFGLWSGTILGAGETGSVYVIDVDGVLLAIELNRDGTQTQAELEEAWAIIASLQITQ